MLVRIRPPKRKGSTNEKAHRLIFFVLALLLLAIVVIAALKVLEWTYIPYAAHLVLGLYVLLVLVYAGWVALLLAEVFNELKAGFRRAAEGTDGRIAHEETVIKWLTQYPCSQVREKSKLVELEAKRWTRRAGIGAAVGAASTVGLNLLGAALKMSATPAPGEGAAGLLNGVTFAVYALMFGVLLGSTMVYVFAARREKVAGILQIAAEREST